MLSRSIWTPSRTRLHVPRTLPTTTSLCDFAESEGIAILWTSNLPDEARWHEGARIIAVRYGMTEPHTVSAIAHELGHWWHGDWCSAPDAERKAWRFAGDMLIDPVRYAEAEQLHPSSGAIARELGVITDVVDAYRRMLHDSPVLGLVQTYDSTTPTP